MYNKIFKVRLSLIMIYWFYSISIIYSQLYTNPLSWILKYHISWTFLFHQTTLNVFEKLMYLFILIMLIYTNVNNVVYYYCSNYNNWLSNHHNNDYLWVINYNLIIIYKLE